MKGREVGCWAGITRVVVGKVWSALGGKIGNKGSEVMLLLFGRQDCQLTFLPYTHLSQAQNRDYNSNLTLRIV